jgi:hypothetical protein
MDGAISSPVVPKKSPKKSPTTNREVPQRTSPRSPSKDERIAIQKELELLFQQNIPYDPETRAAIVAKYIEHIAQVITSDIFIELISRVNPVYWLTVFNRKGKIWLRVFTRDRGICGSIPPGHYLAIDSFVRPPVKRHPADPIRKHLLRPYENLSEEHRALLIGRVRLSMSSTWAHDNKELPALKMFPSEHGYFPQLKQKLDMEEHKERQPVSSKKPSSMKALNLPGQESPGMSIADMLAAQSPPDSKPLIDSPVGEYWEEDTIGELIKVFKDQSLNALDEELSESMD